MAGKRHHYIPRFLQRGFLDEKAKKDYTFMYLDGGAKRPSKIDNVGVEGFFYSAEGETDLDDKITALEGKYAQQINELRENPSDWFCFEDIAEIIYHFEVRTNNFRKNFHSSGEVFLHQMKERFAARDVLEPLLRTELNNKLSTKDAVNKILKENNVPKGLRKEMQGKFRSLVEQYIDIYIDQILSAIKDAIEFNIREKFASVVKKGHINGLLEGLKNNNKVDIYKSLKYQIVKTDFPMLLSDSIVIFELGNCVEFKPFYDTTENLKAIYFPISSNLLIYASTDGNNPKLDVLNEMAAKCSKEFFIACEDSSYFGRMQKFIGKNCQLLTESDMQKILNEVIHEQMSRIGK